MVFYEELDYLGVHTG